MTPLSSRTISWLRFTCAVMVVFLHAFGPPMVPGGAIVWRNGVYDTIRILISQGICQVAVPVFFLISGYLFFVGLEEWNGARYKEKLANRVRSLVVPFLLWGLIAVAVELSVACFRGANPIQWLSDRGWILTLWNNGRFNFNGATNILGWTMYNKALPLNYPLWFVRELIVLNLLAPAIHWLLRNTKAAGLGLLFLLYVFDIWIPLEGFHSGGTFFFSLGAFLTMNRKDLVGTFQNWWTVPAIASPILLIGMTLSFSVYPLVYDILSRLFALAGSITLIVLAAKGLCSGALSVHHILSESSFFIYAGHTLYIRHIACWMIGLIFLTHSQWGLLVTYLLTAPVSVAILLGLFILLKKVFPDLAKVLTGGR